MIQSNNGGTYQWIFKIIRRTSTITLGIDEDTYIRKDEGSFGTFPGQSKLYVIYNDGDRRKWDHDGYITSEDNPKFNTNDKIMMILNLSAQTLSFKKNDGDERILFKNIAVGCDINYCMAIYIHNSGDSVYLCS